MALLPLLKSRSIMKSSSKNRELPESVYEVTPQAVKNCMVSPRFRMEFDHINAWQSISNYVVFSRHVLDADVELVYEAQVSELTRRRFVEFLS